MIRLTIRKNDLKTLGGIEQVHDCKHMSQPLINSTPEPEPDPKPTPTYNPFLIRTPNPTQPYLRAQSFVYCL